MPSGRAQRARRPPGSLWGPPEWPAGARALTYVKVGHRPHLLVAADDENDERVPCQPEQHQSHEGNRHKPGVHRPQHRGPAVRGVGATARADRRVGRRPPGRVGRGRGHGAHGFTALFPLAARRFAPRRRPSSSLPAGDTPAEPGKGLGCRPPDPEGDSAGQGGFSAADAAAATLYPAPPWSPPPRLSRSRWPLLHLPVRPPLTCTATFSPFRSPCTVWPRSPGGDRLEVGLGGPGERGGGRLYGGCCGP